MLRNLNLLRHKWKNQHGFVVVFAVVFLSLALIIALAQASSLLKEFRAVDREGRSVQALLAADSALSCAKYVHGKRKAFDTRGPVVTHDCGIGTFEGGGVNEGEADCVAHTYEFVLDDFDNGACVEVAVTTIPVRFRAGPQLRSECDIRVEARGKSSCAAGAARVVERVRTGRF
jgi:hypothetical protein